ncbi:helix-hairpin-helix domain-containing protein [Natrinema sp. 1APR25-10V2]|uniref:helix-hairpin-helix domain-containing protein n=1 Tax=Natrinema sp. 1APR25-10V2 TaxID=2951081 RepID=UPI00287714DE|nr:helix-hairpin-helix domain-containing protein [Natrinema sp. 1APR25-10V2]MDS0477203.1 DNA double-strand break repair protein Mre11 [Natrinema sp. 1APR25-10V2]
MTTPEGSRDPISSTDTSVTFTEEDIRQLCGDADRSDRLPDLERKGQRVLELVERTFSGHEWFDDFVWGEADGSPGLEAGTSTQEGTRAMWLSLAHEQYREIGGRTKGLQLEFGLDGGDKRGFFDRDVLCGVYLGPWVTESVLEAFTSRLQRHADEIAAHLADHENHVLHVGDRTLRAPTLETVREVGEDCSDGVLLTADLTFADVRNDPEIVDRVCETFASVWPLYGLLAGVDIPATGDGTDSVPADVDRTGEDTPQETTGRSSPTDDPSVEPTRESILAHSDLDEKQIEQTLDALGERGATREEALRILSQYVGDMARGDGLYSVSGLGPMTGYTLEQAGIATVDELVETPLDELRSIDGIRNRRARVILEAASQRTGKPTSGPDDGTGNRSSSAADDDQRVVTDDGVAVEANALSEYYESVRSMRKVLELFILSPDSPHEPDDLTDPLVQYYVLLDACIAFGSADIAFAGYGPQHQSRLPFSTTAYRRAFGNGNWITEYQTIDIEPFQPETREWLRERARFEKPEVLVRPVPPQGEHPLPEVVTSRAELEQALIVLDQFPAYPSVPTDPEGATTDRTVPVSDLYRRIFADLDAEHTVDLDMLSDSVPVEELEGPVVEATPTTPEEIDSFLGTHEKLTHLFGRIEPPSESPVRRSVPAFALDWYRPPGIFFQQLRQLAKSGSSEPVEFFLPRLQDLVNRRLLQDYWEYDYICVFPSHEASSLSEPLVELAQEAVLDTSIIYTPLLERTETVERQRGKSREERLEAVRNPTQTLHCRSKLDGETVVLLDDVSTTGSSLLAGAHALREAGAGRVLALTLGFTPGEAIETRKVTSPDGYASEIVAGTEK